MKITKKTENPLLGRVKLEFEIEHKKQPTPKKEDIKKKIAEMIKSGEELINIEHIYTSFSSGVSKVIAYVYEDEKAFKKMQIKKKKKGKKEAKPSA